MIKLQASVVVAATPEQAFDFVADVENLPKWQNGVFASKVLTAPPMRVGTKFTETFRLMGLPMKAECEVTEMSKPGTFGFKAKGPRMSYTSRFTLEAAGAGTKISVDAEITMHGLWKLLTPMMAAAGRKEAEGEVVRLKAALEKELGTSGVVRLARAG